MALSGELQRGAQQLAGRAAEGTRTPYFSGHARAKVADLSGPSLGAVKSRVRLGLKKVGASPDARGMGGRLRGRRLGLLDNLAPPRFTQQRVVKTASA